jgi:hypothetical protein
MASLGAYKRRSAAVLGDCWPAGPSAHCLDDAGEAPAVPGVYFGGWLGSRATVAGGRARAGFLGQWNVYDAAMVSLEDLAVMHLRQERTMEVRHLAEERIAGFPIRQVVARRAHGMM